MTSRDILTNRKGFALVEIAIVLLIVGLLLAGLVPTISSQIEQRRNAETKKQLDEIKEALIGFAAINGRLPCPASSTGNGSEAFAAGGSIANGNCANFYDGFVPAATLGLSGTDDSGYAVDSWGNRIRYAVTSWNKTPPPVVSNVFTSAGGMSAAGISALSPDLVVCSTATGISATGCASGTSLTSNGGVPAIIYSMGRNGAYGGNGADEAANPNTNADDNNRTFVSHTYTPTSAPNGEFDDIVVWTSPNVLVNRMIAAGKLP